MSLFMKCFSAVLCMYDMIDNYNKIGKKEFKSTLKPLPNFFKMWQSEFATKYEKDNGWLHLKSIVTLMYSDRTGILTYLLMYQNTISSRKYFER